MVRYPQRAILASAALLLFSGCVQSQAPIVDASSGQRNATPPAAPAVAPAAAGVEMLLSRLQALESEVMQLRGIVEEQGYQLETLKQQSLERYIELDKRVGAAAVEGTTGAVEPMLGLPGDGDAGEGQTPATAAAVDAAAAPEPAAGETAETTPTAAATPPATASQSDMDAYREAYGRVKAQDFVGATRAFEAFLETYPNSDLRPNAHYWLGELYLQSPQNLDAAQQAFDLVLTRFPNHGKAPDALYKLGRIAHMRGDNARAEELLQQVIDEYGASGSAAPQLAKQFIDQNFR